MSLWHVFTRSWFCSFVVWIRCFQHCEWDRLLNNIWCVLQPSFAARGWWWWEQRWWEGETVPPASNNIPKQKTMLLSIVVMQMHIGQCRRQAIRIRLVMHFCQNMRSKLLDKMLMLFWAEECFNETNQPGKSWTPKVYRGPENIMTFSKIHKERPQTAARQWEKHLGETHQGEQMYRETDSPGKDILRENIKQEDITGKFQAEQRQ